MVSRIPPESALADDCNPQAWKDLAELHAATGQYQRAAEYYRKAISLKIDDPGLYVGMGAVDLETGRLDEALQAFRLALAVDPRCAKAYGGLAMIHQQRQDYSSAIDLYLKCLELDGDNLVALLGLFQTSCRMGTFAKIIYYLQLYLSQHPMDPSVLFCLASLYAREGKLDQARQALRSVLELEPDKAEARQLLQQVESAAGARAGGIAAS